MSQRSSRKGLYLPLVFLILLTLAFGYIFFVLPKQLPPRTLKIVFEESPE
jgi:hypothetical protein